VGSSFEIGTITLESIIYLIMWTRKFKLGKPRTVSVVLIIVFMACMSFLSDYQLVEKLHGYHKTIFSGYGGNAVFDEKFLNRAIEPGSILAVINTEKCGTGSMQSSIKNSLRCYEKGPFYQQARVYYGCEHGGELIRTHNSGDGAKAIEMLREGSSDKKCAVMSAFRSPQTWVPSAFMQLAGICHTKMSYKEYEKQYHEYIMKHSNDIRGQLIGTRTHLMKEFGITFTEVMESMKKNHGYSLHNNPSPDGSFANCELLMLRMEDGEKWREIFATLYPGVKYAPNEKRTDACPEIANHYRAIEKRKFTAEERIAIISDNPKAEEFFKIYDM